MTKSENREIQLCIKHFNAGLGADYLARALSGLYRSARSATSRLEILAIADQYDVIYHPEFIVR
jgi:hypothetical protein